MIDDSKAKVCATNLRALQNALDIYAMEHDTLPGDLTQIPFEYIRRAHANLLRGKGGWQIKLASFLVDFDQKGTAYATIRTFLRDDLAKGDLRLITCPSNVNSAVSYGIFSGLVSNLSRNNYSNISAGVVLIGDSDSDNFAGEGGLAHRHRHGSQYFAQGTVKGGAVVKDFAATQPPGE
jgi:hypothetical protein